MSTRLVILMNPELKERLRSLARREGKTPARLVRELIEEYVRKNDKGSYIDGLWERVGKKLRSKGATPATVRRAIKDVREQNNGA